jgi:hypothetical protein
VLSCNSPAPIIVSATFYGDGAAYTGANITLQPGEVRWISLTELNAPTQRKLVSNEAVELAYLGHMLEVGAQITLFRRGNAGTIDVPFNGGMDYHSNVQEAVWASPIGAAAHLSVANSTDRYVAATVSHSSGDVPIELGPFATQTLVLRSRSTVGVDSARIDSRGAVGAIRATGFVEVRQRIVSGIRFYDPSVATQPVLFASNVQAFDALPTIVLKNTTGSSITATTTILPLEEEHAPLSIGTTTLGPYAASAVDFEPLRKASTQRPELGRVSVKVTSSGPVGSLIGALSLSGSQGSMASDIPLRDPGHIRQATGSYPWRLDDDYDTIVSITNVADSGATFHAWINYAGGTYWFEARDLAAGATALFDIRKIRDNRVADKEGSVLPSSIHNGQFRWSIVKAAGQTKLNGRAEIVSSQSNRRTSYSCSVCCPNSYLSGYLYPSGLSVPVDYTGDTTVMENFKDYYGGFAGNYPVNPSEWWVGNPSVTHVWNAAYATGRAAGDSGGDSGIAGGWDAEEYYTDITETICYYDSVAGQAPGDVRVRVPASLSKASEGYTDNPPPPYTYNVVYQVRDQYGDAMPGNVTGGLWVVEWYSPASGTGNCSLGEISTGGNVYANAAGQFFDNYSLGSGAPNPCTTTATQYIAVNSRQVSQKTITWQYSGVTVP